MGVPIHGYPGGLRASDPPKAARDLEHSQTAANHEAFAKHRQECLIRDGQPPPVPDTVSSLIGESYRGMVEMNERLNLIAVRLRGTLPEEAGAHCPDKEPCVRNAAERVRDLVNQAHYFLDHIDAAI